MTPTAVALNVPYPPSVNHYWRNIGKGRTILSKQARDYKAPVQQLAMFHRIAPMAGPVVIRVKVYRPRKSGDLDNILKGLLDSLKGIMFEDDSQIVRIEADRFDDKADPRAFVTVSAA